MTDSLGMDARGNVLILKVCQRCGEEFYAIRNSCKFCSRRCSNITANETTKAATLEKPRQTIWSCGGGVDSTAIAVLICQGQLPVPDYALMVDVGYETDSTWAYVHEVLQPRLRRAGCELHIIPTSQYTTTELIDNRGHCVLPVCHVATDGTKRKFNTHCSGKWKQFVARKWLREQGVERCEQWLGIAAEETRRCHLSTVQWIELRYPLVEIGLTRTDCVYLIGQAGWPLPQHTSCYFCPNRDNAGWRRLYETEPEFFAKAVQVEKELQTAQPGVYLHHSFKPLDSLPFLPSLPR
jgi:hypothetical protein